jgi:hypothetical protein
MGWKVFGIELGRRRREAKRLACAFEPEEAFVVPILKGSEFAAHDATSLCWVRVLVPVDFRARDEGGTRCRLVAV